ncbi:MAG: type II toxin-antitoxin system HicA family toxin [Granulosicoccus sp.]
MPRDLSGAQLVKALQTLGYNATRQTGSHIRLSSDSPEEHHITIPNHDSLRVGTLSAILADVATHQGLSRDELLERLFTKKQK